MSIQDQSVHIKRACEIVGSQIVLANLLEITPAGVSQWATNLRPVPIEKCVAIEQITKGEVTRKDLRPDDWQQIWPELAEQPVDEHHRTQIRRGADRQDRRNTDPKPGA